MSKEYIGDGVYAEFDGFALTLSTERMENGVNWIVLEPRELEAVNAFVKRCREPATPPPHKCSYREDSTVCEICGS